MNPAYLLKNLPTPLQQFIKPMLLISMGLHGMILAMPMPEKSKHESAKKPPIEKVKITQLPTSSTPPLPKTSVKPSPVPSIKPSPKPSPIVPKLVPRLVTRINQPIIRQPQPVRSPVPRPTPTTLAKAELTPTAKPAPAPVAGSTPAPSSTSTAEPTPVPTSAPEATPAPTVTPSSSAEDPFANFPRYPNSQPGSLEVLPAEADKSANNTEDKMDQVVVYFNTQLEANKFTMQPSSDEANAKVYQVTKGNTTQFLHLISRQEKTVIVLAPQPLDLANLKDLEVEQQTAEERAFDDLLVTVDEELILASLEGGLSNLIEPEKFSDAPNIKLDRILGTTKTKTADELGSFLQGKLGGQGFTLASEGTYGGGSLYKVTNGSFTRYLSLIPTKDSRTAILSLKDSPLK